MEADEYHAMFAAEDHHWWYVGLHDLVIHSVQGESACLKRPLDILDAGCGTGRLCQLMHSYGPVTGCDMHPLALEATAKRGIARVLHRDLTADDLAAEAYDVITCMDVLYHRGVTDEITVLQKLRRSLKKGGLLVVQVAAFESLRGTHDLVVHTRHRYRRGEIVRLLERAGFTVEFASYRLLLGFLPALVWRCFTRLFPTHSGNGKTLSDLAMSVSPLANQILTAGVKMENLLLVTGVRLPLGTSVFAIARK